MSSEQRVQNEKFNVLVLKCSLHVFHTAYQPDFVAVKCAHTQRTTNERERERTNECCQSKVSSPHKEHRVEHFYTNTYTYSATAQLLHDQSVEKNTHKQENDRYSHTHMHKHTESNKKSQRREEKTDRYF